MGRECPNSRSQLEQRQEQLKRDFEALQAALAVLTSRGEHTTDEYRAARQCAGNARQTLSNLVMWVNIQQALESQETVDVLLSGLWPVLDFIDDSVVDIEDIGRKIQEQKQ